MAKELRIDDPGLIQQARETAIVIIGDRSFVALESIMTVQDETGLFELDDEEVAMLREAAEDTRPRLRGTSIDEYLARQLQEFGRD